MSIGTEAKQVNIPNLTGTWTAILLESRLVYKSLAVLFFHEVGPEVTQEELNAAKKQHEKLTGHLRTVSTLADKLLKNIQETRDKTVAKRLEGFKGKTEG